MSNKQDRKVTQRVALPPHRVSGIFMSSDYSLCRASPVLHVHVDFLNVLSFSSKYVPGGGLVQNFPQGG